MHKGDVQVTQLNKFREHSVSGLETNGKGMKNDSLVKRNDSFNNILILHFG